MSASPIIPGAERCEGDATVEAEHHGENTPDIARCIAIDGPSAAGKSAVGSRVAERLGYRFVDTGMMYRAITWLAHDRKIEPEDEATLTQLVEEVSIAVDQPTQDAPAGRVRVDGLDVTGRLRSTEVGMAVSLISRVPAVREAMVRHQRALAQEGGVVMAGRDIGTVVLPQAPLKVYLDASIQERVRRRHAELHAAGRVETLEQVRDELAHRDEIDSARSVSPLRAADDAVILDTDDISLEQVVERILELASCRS